VHQPLHREPLQLVSLQRRDLRLVHAQQPRRLGLCQLARRQNRVQAPSRTFVPNSTALGNPYVVFAWIMLAKISTLLNQS
jgi:hypothetical protein